MYDVEHANLLISPIPIFMILLNRLPMSFLKLCHTWGFLASRTFSNMVNTVSSYTSTLLSLVTADADPIKENCKRIPDHKEILESS